MTKKKQKYILYLIAVLSVFVRLAFVVCSEIIEPGMQNDMGSLNENCFGHLGYIYYLANGGDIIFNGADVHYQFYHPPLHYMICALWLKVTMSFGVSLLGAAESLQLLTCTYSVLTLLFVDKIVRKLGGNDRARIATLSLTGFFPYAVFMSGSINNDGLCLLLMVMTVYYLFLFYEESTVKNALLLSLCFGLAAMTKISALILGPGIAFLLLYQFVRNKRKRRFYVMSYALIGTVSLVLGLWYPVKNYLVYGMELLYIPRLELDSEQYIGQIKPFLRFFDFNPKLFTSLGIVFNETEGMPDYNIFLSLLKYSAFAESDYYMVAEGISRILFFLFGALLTVVTVVAVNSFFRAKWKTEYKIMLGLLCGANMVSYLRFCFTHPHVCTMHVRYIMLSVMLTMICAGFRGNGKKRKDTVWSGVLGLYVMTACSFIGLYFLNLYFRT